VELKELPTKGQAGGLAGKEAKQLGHRPYTGAESGTGGLSLSAGWDTRGARRV